LNGGSPVIGARPTPAAASPAGSHVARAAAVGDHRASEMSDGLFKSTVDFLDWQPATWISPEGHQYQVVFSNDHALTVMAYNETEVVIRDPLGPTTTNTTRPYQYRVSWERFLEVFASQGNDGLAIMPPAAGGSAPAPASTPAATADAPAPTPGAPDTDFAKGDVVEVADDPLSLALNLRSEASTGGDVVEELKPGTQLEITGEPAEADGYSWYPVKVIATGEAGFVVAEYLVPHGD
jgi:hypothetical protein